MVGKKKVGKKRVRHSRKGGHTRILPAHLMGKHVSKKIRRKKG
jgi:hypothetical protein